MIPESKLIEENQSHHISPSSYVTEDALKISEIYRNELNILIWKRNLNNLLIKSSEIVLDDNLNLEYSEVLKPDEVKQSLESVLGDNIKTSPFIEDVSYLSFIFCRIFDQKKLCASNTCPTPILGRKKKYELKNMWKSMNMNQTE